MINKITLLFALTLLCQVQAQLVVGDTTTTSTFGGVQVRCSLWDGTLCTLPEFFLPTEGDWFRTLSKGNCQLRVPTMFCLVATQGVDQTFARRTSGNQGTTTHGHEKRWDMNLGSTQCDPTATGFVSLSAGGMQISGFPRTTISSSYDTLECSAWISTQTDSPTNEPSIEPTMTPTSQPSKAPTAEPSLMPTSDPSLMPTQEPTSTTTTTVTACSTEQKAIHVTDNTADGRQWYPVVEKLTDGRLVVAWEDLGTEDNMFRVYNADLTPATAAIAFGRGLTMQSTWGWQAREAVRALPDGGFIMSVTGAEIGATFANGRFELKTFDSSLTQIHSTLFGAHLWGEPNRSLMEPKIALLQNGGFMVTFRISHCGMTWSCFAAQIFDAELNLAGPWFYVDGRVRGGDEHSPTKLNLNGDLWSGLVRTLVSLPNGNVMLIHNSMNADSAGTTSASIWNDQGVLVKPHFLIPDVVATRAHQSDHYAHAAVLSNNNIVVAWTRWQRENADGTGADQRTLLFQILDQDGTKLGLNHQTWGPMESTGASPLTVGGYVMVAATEGKFTISSHSTSSNHNVFTREFSNDGTANAAIVNEMENLHHSFASRAVIEYGSDNYVIAVQGGRIDNTRDAQEGIFLIGQPSCTPPVTTTTTTLAPPCLTEQQSLHVTDNTADGRQWYPVVEKLTDGRLVVAWEDLGTEDNMFRVYNADLTPATAAIAFGRDLTIQGSWGWQAREAVRALPDGGFIMSVTGAEIGATFANGCFQLKKFDSSLTQTHSKVFGGHIWGEPNRSLMEPKIALLQSGFMVTFRISHCGMTWSCHAAQIFDADLNPVGTWFYVDGRVRGGDEHSPAVLTMPGGPWSGHVQTSVALRNGNVLLVHSGMNAITAGTTSVSIWDIHGVLVKSHFLLPNDVATRAHQSDHYAHAALLSNGNVVVAWTRWQRANSDGSGADQRELLFQILDQDGNMVGLNQRTWGPMESTDATTTFTVGGYVMVASTEGKFTISSHPASGNNNVFTRTFLNDGTADGAIVTEMENLGVSFASRAVIEYGSDNYVIAVQGSRIDNTVDAQEGIFLIGKPSCTPQVHNPVCDSMGSSDTFKFTFTRSCINGWSSTCADGFALYGLYGEKIDLASLNPVVTDTGFWRSGAHSYIGAEIQENVGLAYCSEPLRCTTNANLDPEVVTITLDRPVAFSSFDIQQVDKMFYRPIDFTLEILTNGAFETVTNAPFDLAHREIRNFGNDCNIHCDMLAYGSELKFTFKRQCVNDWSSTCVSGLALIDLMGDKIDVASLSPTVTDTGFWRSGAHSYIGKEILENVGLTYCSEPLQCQSGTALDDEIVTITLNQPVAFSSFNLQQADKLWYRPSEFTLEVRNANGAFDPVFNAPFDLGLAEIRNFGNHCNTQSPTMEPTAMPTSVPTGQPTQMPTSDPTPVPGPEVCEKRGQCVNSNGGAVFATMTARRLLTKAECISAFESCADAAGASFRTSTNTCQIFGDGALPTCSAVSGWQPGNVLDQSTGPVTSTTGNAPQWADVTCFSPNLCAPPVCEMRGQCQNSQHNAIFATMSSRVTMTKEECTAAFQACGDASSASWRASTSTCQIFGNGGLPSCAEVTGWQPGNVGDRSTGPVTSTTGNAAPWADVTCFSENLCDSVVRMQLDVEGWTQSDFTANKDAFTRSLANALSLSPSQVQVSLRRLGWLRRNLQQGLPIYVRIKAQDADMATINSQLANPSVLTSALETRFASTQFTLVSSEVKSVQEAQASSAVQCPAGSVLRTGYSHDGTWTTYTDTIEDCKQACDLQTPNHGNRPARPCNAFMWSPTVRAGTKGQCWRFENATPEFPTNIGDFTYCERTDVVGQIMDSGADCGASNAITTEAECRQYAASLGITFSWVGIVHAPGGCFWHHNTGMSGSQITNIGFNSDLTDNGSGWGGVGKVCKESDVFVAGGDACPAQSEHLTHVDCRDAAEKLGIYYWGSNPAAPRGCWKFVNPVNGATYAFGNVNDGNNIQPADISPICRTTNEPDNALSLLGAGRCKANGSIIPLGGYVLQTPKAKCIADCEADANCVAAMPAYNYYCQLFMKSTVAAVDDVASNYQTQWECYAKSNPDKIVTMEMRAQGMTSAQFAAQKRELASSFASSLGVPAGRVELSLTPFHRRRLYPHEDDDGMTVFARIEAKESEIETINEKTNDPEALATELSENTGVAFEVKSTDVQDFQLNESPNSNQEVITETKSKGVSIVTFVISTLVCLLLGVGAGLAVYSWFCNKSTENAEADLETGDKRLPFTSQPELKKEISLQNVADAPSKSLGLYNTHSSSLGGTSLQEGERKDS